jgi:nucleoside-diphosphate-sugar epimerase
MTTLPRVLITGHNGYIGSVMASHLLQAGYDVVGLDTEYFGQCTLVPDRIAIRGIRKDIRDVTPADLEGIDAVVHLAALSNDPLGDLNAGWTEEINFQASVQLARLAKAAGVQRFLFSSSCIMYGMSEAEVVTEESPLDPRTEYARSKAQAERAIAPLAGDGFSPVFLRNGTVYGLSPRMRFDTVLNNLVGSAVATGRVVVHSDGTPWRPVVHVQDVARLFQAVLEAPDDVVHGQVFNAGANHLNHQVIDLARMVARTVPGAELEVVARPGADQRTYRADFTKFAHAFPEFRFRWTPEDGAGEVYEAFTAIGVSRETFADKRFTRLKWLGYLLAEDQLDGSLRWTERKVGAKR